MTIGGAAQQDKSHASSMDTSRQQIQKRASRPLEVVPRASNVAAFALRGQTANRLDFHKVLQTVSAAFTAIT